MNHLYSSYVKENKKNVYMSDSISRYLMNNQRELK